MSLILASASPRRQELLQQIGVSFVVQAADIDETPLAGETPLDYVARLARNKASRVAMNNAGSAVLAADTTVVGQQQILGKPESREHGEQMLRLLSGSWHDVSTGVALLVPGNESAVAPSVVSHQVVTTRVRFRDLSEGEISAYLDTREGIDKAGGYGIQGMGAVLVERIEGSYSNVVGLPLAETAVMLRQSGISIWQ
jgi:septum formation protein